MLGVNKARGPGGYLRFRGSSGRGVLGANKARGPGGYSRFTEGVGALDIMLFSYVRKFLEFQETY